MFGFEFANPKYFLLLILLIPMILWYVLREKRSHADLQFSSLRAFKGIKHTGRIWWRHILFVLEVLAIILLIMALARPQSDNSWQTYTSEGIDIVLALDISGSMLARDFSPTVWKLPRRWQLNLFSNGLRIKSDWLYLPGKVLHNVL